MEGPNWNTVMFLLTVTLLTIQLSPCKGLGVCYGRNGNDLPSPNDVINLYKKCGIQFIRLFDPDQQVLQALQGSNLRVSLGVRNEDLNAIASSQTAANAWVNANIVPYKNVTFSWITLGNEVIPGPYAAYVPQAMKNIQTSISRIGLTNTKVTTVVSMNVLAASYPPSAGTFKSELVGVISQVAAFLLSTNAPLMLNVYPYFAYVSDPAHISLEYATFQTSVPVIDGNLKYYNLFYAMVDAVNAALEKINAGKVAIVVSETGWPSAGNEPYTSRGIADAYNHNLFNHVQKEGTPRRPNEIMQTFIFAMFNENLKPFGIEQHWGLFYPNKQPVYPMFENCLQ